MAAATVVLLTPSLDYGGAEVMIVGLAQTLRAVGWSVFVVSMLEPRAFVTELEALDIQVVSLGMTASGANVSGITRLIGLLRKIRPSLIHAHMFHANILARALRPFMRIPVICTVHNVRESSRRRDTVRLRNWMYRLTDWSCDRTTAVAEAARTTYIRNRMADEARIQTIPNGVDTERFRRDATARAAVRRRYGWSNEFIWIAVGRLELAKDYPTMISAFRELWREHPEARLAIAGDGRLRGELESFTERTGLAGAVRFLGNQTNVPELLSGADAFVLSSAWEGAPVALLEAAACELPVVTTDAGGSSELVVDGTSGYIVPCGDRDALAAGMKRVMEAPEEARAQMGAVGRAYVECRYSTKRVFEKYAALYQEVQLPCSA